MSLLDSFDAPIVETIGGKTYTFPLLDVDDLALVSREILHAKMTKELAAANMTDANARNEIVSYYNSLDFDIDGYCQMVATPASALKILAKSAVKGGIDPGIVKQVQRERGLRGVVSLALEVSNLYAPNPKRAKSPNAEAAGADSDPAASPVSEPTTPTPDSPSGVSTAIPAA